MFVSPLSKNNRRKSTIRSCRERTPGKQPKAPVIESRTGDAVITHFGLSGPIVLEMSLPIIDALQNGPVSVAFDLAPDKTRETLRQELQKSLDRLSKRTYRNFLKELLPPKLGEPFVQMTGIHPDKLANQITAEEREKLLNLMKSLRFEIKEAYSMATAMVTAGGISLKEIDSRTMASKIIAGLYLCGEVMDIDAGTGGYNLQAAFSTGYVAGESASIYVTS
jgi:predicted Rossmann fold flavoprotein